MCARLLQHLLIGLGLFHPSVPHDEGVVVLVDVALELLDVELLDNGERADSLQGLEEFVALVGGGGWRFNSSRIS